MVEAQSGAEVVALREVCLEHQRDVCVFLVDVVCFPAENGVSLMHRPRSHQSNVGGVFWVYDKGILGVCLISVGVDGDSEQRSLSRHAVFGLSAPPFLLQPRQPSVEDVAVALPEPSRLRVVLLHARLVVEPVVVLVVVVDAVLVVQHQVAACAFADVQIGCGIGLDAALRVAEEIHLHRLLVLRL